MVIAVFASPGALKQYLAALREAQIEGRAWTAGENSVVVITAAPVAQLDAMAKLFHGLATPLRQTPLHNQRVQNGGVVDIVFCGRCKRDITSLEFWRLNDHAVCEPCVAGWLDPKETP